MVYPVHTLDVYALGNTTTNWPGCCSVRQSDTSRSVNKYGGTYYKLNLNYRIEILNIICFFTIVVSQGNQIFLFWQCDGTSDVNAFRRFKL